LTNQKQLRNILVNKSDKTENKKPETELKMQHTVIYPEMGETTNATIEYRVAYGGKLSLATDLELKGRGIQKRGDGSDYKRGKKTYLVTKLAFKKIEEKYDTCYIADL
jgi:hypothetical protein